MRFADRLAAAAALRIRAAERRMDASDALVFSGRDVPPRPPTPDPDPEASPSLPRAGAAWLVSLLPMMLSHAAMAVAIAVAAERRGQATGVERPAARPRDGP